MDLDNGALIASLLLLGQLQGGLLALALLSRVRRNAPAQRWAGVWLALLLLSLALALSLPLLQELGIWLAWPRCVLLLSGLPLLFGPLLYLHVGTKTGQLRRPNTTRAVALAGSHAVLPVVFYTLALLWLALDDGSLRQMLAVPADASQRFSLLPTAKHASFIGYSLASLGLLRRYQRGLCDHLAEVEPYALPWLKVLVGSSLLLSLGLAVLWLTGWSGLRHDLGLALALVALIVAAGFHSLKVTPVFLGESAGQATSTVDSTSVATVPAESEAKSPSSTADPLQEARALLDHTELAALQQKLESLASREDLLFDHNLTLPRLAAALACTSHQLSWTLNQVRGESFYDLINRLRIAAVLSRLRDPQRDNLPVLDIALGCGFSNKTTFYKAFRQVTGTTPLLFRRDRSLSAAE